MKTLLLFTVLFTSSVFANEFIDLAKRTSSVYSQVSDVDFHNPGNVNFETLLSNQKVYLAVSATKLNSSFITIINSEASSSKKILNNDKVIKVHDLDLVFDTSATASNSCNGILDSQTTHYDCFSKNCNVKQRVVSKCNETDCWESNPTGNRPVTAPLSENFKLLSKVDVSDCVPNNIAGQKHSLNITVKNDSASNLRGGSVQTVLWVQNDIYTPSKARR